MRCDALGNISIKNSIIKPYQAWRSTEILVSIIILGVRHLGYYELLLGFPVVSQLL